MEENKDIDNNSEERKPFLSAYNDESEEKDDDNEEEKSYKDNTEPFLSEEEQLNDEEEDLRKEIEEEEDEEFLPPKEKENLGKQLNIGNIFALIFIAMIIFIVFIMVITSGSKKKKTEENELDKAGYKNEYNWDDKNNRPTYVVVENGFTFDENGNINPDQSELNQIANAQPTIPSQYELPNRTGDRGTAPQGVAPAGSTKNSKSEKPDTRNSRSPRKIEGLKGQNYNSNSYDYSNAAYINSVANGTYQNPNQISKEQYIQNTQAAAGMTDNSKMNFFNQSSGEANTGEFLAANSLWDGTVISGILTTAIDTQNPGVVIARVSENVYSSYDHSYLLIPEGTILFGEYNYNVSYGQTSIQVGWNLLIRPDGYRMQLGNFNGVNQQGASGYKGSINNHPWETLKAMGLIAIFSILETEIVSDINSQNNEYLKNAMTDVYAQASQVENQILEKALDIKPTIKIKEGTEVKLITNIPLTLPPVKIPEPTQKYVRTK